MTVWGKEWDRNSRFQNNPIKAGKVELGNNKGGWFAPNAYYLYCSDNGDVSSRSSLVAGVRVSYTQPDQGACLVFHWVITSWLFFLSLPSGLITRLCWHINRSVSLEPPPPFAPCICWEVRAPCKWLREDELADRFISASVKFKDLGSNNDQEGRFKKCTW